MDSVLILHVRTTLWITWSRFFVYSSVSLFPWFYEIPSFAILLFQSFEIILVHFIYSYNNNHLLVVQSSSSPTVDLDVKIFIGPLCIGISFPNHRKYRVTSARSSLFGSLTRTNKQGAMNCSVILAVSISRENFACRYLGFVVWKLLWYREERLFDAWWLRLP